MGLIGLCLGSFVQAETKILSPAVAARCRLDYELLVRRGMTKLPNGYWTEETVVYWIHELQAAGFDLQKLATKPRPYSKADFRKQGITISVESLLNSAHSVFGGWKKALRVAGIALPEPKWSKEGILEELKKMKAAGAFDAGSPYKNWREHPYVKSLPYSPDQIQKAAREPEKFGSWENALKAIGVKIPGPKWTIEVILSELHKMNAAGVFKYSATHTNWRNHPYVSALPYTHTTFYTVVRDKFGSWKAALKAAGIELPHPDWTNDFIISELRKMKAAGVFDNLTSQRSAWRNHAYFDSVPYSAQAIHSAAEHPGRFGSWEAALRTIGVTLPRGPKWPKERIVEELRKMKAAGVFNDLSLGNSNWKEHPYIATLSYDIDHLQRAAERAQRFGSWGAALRAVGVEIHTIKWTKDSVLEEIRKMKAAGVFDHWKSISQRWHDHPYLATLPYRIEQLQAASRLPDRFGSWLAALRAAGVTVPEPKWTRDFVLEELRKMKAAGVFDNLAIDGTWRNHPYIDTLPYSLNALQSAVRRMESFTSWRAALRAAGIEPPPQRLRQAWLYAETQQIEEGGRVIHFGDVLSPEDAALRDQRSRLAKSAFAHYEADKKRMIEGMIEYIDDYGSLDDLRAAAEHLTKHMGRPVSETELREFIADVLLKDKRLREILRELAD